MAESRILRVVGGAGVALAAVAAVGLTPAVSAGPALAAATYYLEGTRIGDITGHQPPLDFSTGMMTGAGLTAPSAADFEQVRYPASIWPFSKGGLGDPTWNASVAQGVANLGEQPEAGDTVFGFSQGAVVATAYKREHPNNGVNYVLVENPGRPNGGIMQRFKGLHIPLLNISFGGATPVVRDPAPGAGSTVDIARQYDGWADFPTYPLNLLATVNAVLGIVYLHGDTQDLGAADIADIDKTDPRFYQRHGDTTYYLIPTKRLPLLMPLQGLLPTRVLDALDAPLRRLVELGYDRRDYSKATGARLFPPLRLPRPPAPAPAPDAAELASPEPVSTEPEVAESTKPAVRAPATRKPVPWSTLRRAAGSMADTLRSPRTTGPKKTATGKTDAGKPDADKADKADKADTPTTEKADAA